LWDRDGAGGFAPDVPISDGLRARLAAWCRSYEDTEFYLPASMRQETSFDLQAFCDEGLAIARAIKAELPDWTVVYFDQAKCPARWKPGMSRDAFEYEVDAVAITAP
jgi:hypothetical protein